MIKVSGKRTLALYLSVLSLPVFASDFDGSRPLLCASIELFECTAAKCTAVTTESVDAPQFFSIDFVEKTLTGSDGVTDGPPSEVRNVTLIGNQLVLQGINDSVGWSFSIAQETGKLVAVATSDAAGFVIFGACRAS